VSLSYFLRQGDPTNRQYYLQSFHSSLLQAYLVVRYRPVEEAPQLRVA
jgi:hypothetical protein